MCELSVDDEGQQSEQDDKNRHRHDYWNNGVEHWVQNELRNGHKIENWVQNELTGGHKSLGKSWNNRMQDGHWIQDKMTGCHKSWQKLGHKVVH